jgi:hypothetical protein
MTSAEMIRYRLINQQISGTKFKTPQQIVEWMIAMQAQEFAMAKWAIGLRLPGSVESDIEAAFAKGELLRTHLMRPTWHFVTPADIRWLLALTAPRVHTASAFMHRQLELDKKMFKRSNDTLIKALSGGKQLTREHLRAALKQKKIKADGTRLAHLLMQAELDGVICSGPRQGKQFTYALLEERVAPTKTVHRTEALTELTQRYFTSRGPATIKDFTTWSGLTVADAKEGVRMLPSKFIKEEINGQEYYFIPNDLSSYNKIQTSFLMPDYDEYGMSYKDRSVLLVSKNDTLQFRGENPAYNRMIIIDGKIEGTWKRIIKNNTVSIETVPFRPLSKSRQQVLARAIKKYCLFIGKKVEE